MINWAHDVIIVLISTGLATLFAGGGWLYRWWRDKKNIRLLVEIEIIDNQTQLRIFVETLQALSSEDRHEQALYFDEATSYYVPKWRRTRWDTVSPGVFTPKESFKIGFWYHQLELIQEVHRYILSQSVQGRRLVQQNPALKEVSIGFILEKLENMEKFAASVLKAGPPFTDKRLEKVNEDARKQWEALKQGQGGLEA